MKIITPEKNVLNDHPGNPSETVKHHKQTMDNDAKNEDIFGPSVKVLISDEAREAQEGKRDATQITAGLSPDQARHVESLFEQMNNLFGPGEKRDLSDADWEKAAQIYDELDSMFGFESARAVLGENEFKRVRGLEEELDSIFNNAPETGPTKEEKKRVVAILNELDKAWTAAN